MRTFPLKSLVLAGVLVAAVPAGGAAALSPIPPPTLQLYAFNNAGKADALIVKGPRYTAGGTIRLVRTAAPGQRRQLVAAKTSNKHGDVRFRVSDLNGADPTRYRAVIVPVEDEYPRGVSNRRTVR